MAVDRWHIPTSDEEIVVVFLEEVGELLENIDNHMKFWMAHPDDKKPLTEIRRSFHTLKGSGRMVKALDLSEVAWKVEKMLNQAIAGTVPVSESMVKLVAAARAQIPRLVDAFRTRQSVAESDEVEHLMKTADAITAGTSAAREPAQAPIATAVPTGKQHLKLYEMDLKLERFMQRADEALHRSEMALQQARRISPQSVATESGSGVQASRSEVERIGELVNLLSKEVSEVRLESKKSQRESILRQTEVNHLIGQRVRARLVPIEHRISEIKRDVEENHRAVAALGRFGWRSLIISALIGGMIALGLYKYIQSLG